ncbi:MAG: hypothetical protein COU51_03750 [Parcubacteria group bacterium CG10_big_fil_rev_8_21_14_0_10_36_14]|nr:MAG: hypothetical protein COU51_03750 [Parcubacteria group bacterium CG10_big_fil_rev_8_21_14_0_10_36_14]
MAKGEVQITGILPRGKRNGEIENLHTVNINFLIFRDTLWNINVGGIDGNINPLFGEPLVQVVNAPDRTASGISRVICRDDV